MRILGSVNEMYRFEEFCASNYLLGCFVEPIDLLCFKMS